MEECPRRVRAALRTIPAAYEVGFDIDKDEVYVSYDAATRMDPKELAKVVEQRAGFKAWVKGEGWGDASVKDLKALPL
jgi:hypothetical protein